MPLFATQPLKGFYAIYAILSTLTRLPFVATLALFPRFRPHPEWTFTQTVANHVLHAFLYHSTIVRLKTPQNLSPGGFKERYITIAPSFRPIYTDILSSQPAIKPSAIGAAWYPSFPNTEALKDEGLIVLHFHGGGFLIGDSRADAADAGNLLTTYIAPHALLLDYRLASNPLGYFPAALQDAVSAYSYLLESQVPASNIIISGDSAGGNLVIGLLRYIAATGHLPSPRAALLWSPPTDASGISHGAATNISTDYMEEEFLKWMVDAYSNGGKIDIKDPYVTPLGSPFKTESKIWLHYGGLERFAESLKKWAEEMKGLEGNKVEVYVEALANHDIMYVGKITGFKAEAEEAAKAAKAFAMDTGTS